MPLISGASNCRQKIGHEPFPAGLPTGRKRQDYVRVRYIVQKKRSVHQGLGQPFLLAVLDRTPHIIAVKNAKGELVVMPARKKAKHRTAKIVQ